MSKKKTRKKKELTAKEKLAKLIKDGKVLSKPYYEGDTEAKEEKLMTSRDVPAGFALVGASNGITFSSDPDARTSEWFRADRWVAVCCKPEHLNETLTVLEDYLIDKLADYYESIIEMND